MCAPQFFALQPKPIHRMAVLMRINSFTAKGALVRAKKRFPQAMDPTTTAAQV
jgi:hypothetical protein